MIVEAVAFDESGASCDVRNLRFELGARDSLQSFLSYIVRNLGYIAVSHDFKSTQILLRPTAVSDAALVACFTALGDKQPSRTTLNIYDDPSNSWQHFILGPWARAIEQLAILVARSRREVSNVLISKPTNLARLERKNYLLSALSFWRGCSGFMETDELSRLLAEVLTGRYVLFDATSEAFIIRGVGDGVPEFARLWLSRTIGMPVQDQPDYLYGRSCAETYARALQQHGPLLEDVDAIANWPGYGPTRRTYQRLVLPVHISGRRCILSATLPDTKIDLRAA
jgi:hypothetical protein